MAGFVLADQVEPLAYDFGAYGPSGVTPEPSQGGLTRFLTQIKDLAQVAGVDAADLQDAAPAEVARVLDSLDEHKLEETNGQMVDALADLCQGHPTRDEIQALPARIQQAWTGWLMGQLTDPTKPKRVSSP